jgi:SAM-dependent methyltransferase
LSTVLDGSVGPVPNERFWERNALWWQERFTEGADPEYEEQVLPLAQHYLVGARRVLDLGCGEGQVSRRLAATDVAVVGMDPVRAQIRAAHERGGAVRCIQAGAQHIPCGGGTFDAVVLCLALEHIEPFEPVIEEIARVLVPGGRFVLLLGHPLLQAPGSGWVVDESSDRPYWRIGAYLRDDVVIDEVAPDVFFSFVHRPLSRYIHVMGANGLLVDDMAEPAPTDAVVAETGGFALGYTIPRLLVLSARRSS